MNRSVKRTNKEEAEIDVLEHIKSSEKAQKGKNIGILVLSIAVVSLKIECVGARRGWRISSQTSAKVVKKGGDDEIGILGPGELRMAVEMLPGGMVNQTTKTDGVAVVKMHPTLGQGGV